jgi:MoxR-like ATPase
MASVYEFNKDAVELQQRIERFHDVRDGIMQQVRQVIVGQQDVLEQILIALFVGGHCLVTGMPGTAKTLMVRTIADALGLRFRRIQFTPDLMPSDITGTDIIEEDLTTGHRKWTFVEGPIFGNIILADEINRTPPKTQAALLEAMQEHSCTVRGHIYSLPEPFFVLATQNPIELEGTYPLPEAQLDRFLFNAKLGYLSVEDELKVVDQTTVNRAVNIQAVTSADELLDFQRLVRMVPIADALARYVGRSRFCEEVCQLWRQHPRRAVHRAGREGAGTLTQTLSRDLRGHHVRHRAGAASSHPAQFSCRVGLDRQRRDSQSLDRRSCAPQGDLMQRFLEPAVLAGISSLDLVAKTVVDGFVAGLHRSPDFGFSQEFAEYRAYAPGDDLRHVDWNLFARTERCYLKRYRGETNSQLTILLDASNSMEYSSVPPKKMDYARFIAASLFYLAIHNQRDAAGVIVFDEKVRDVVRPSTRPGQLARLFAALERAEPHARTDFARPLHHFQELLHRRGIAIVISDFYEDPETIVRTIEPLRYRGNEVVLFHILDPDEIRPVLKSSAILIDLETDQKLEVIPDYAKTSYRDKIDAHIEQLRSRTRASGMDYQLLVTNQPLDAALRSYLALRKERN